MAAGNPCRPALDLTYWGTSNGGPWIPEGLPICSNIRPTNANGL